MTMPLYDHTTPAYAEFMARIDKMPKAQLANIVKWVIDDIYGVGEGDPHGPRALDNQQEAASTSDTVMRIAGTLFENNLIPPEYCECGNAIDLDGYDGKCATCADKTEESAS